MSAAGAAIGMSAATGAINSALGMGFGALSGLINNAIYKKTYKELGQWQNDMNIANWNMVNEYNSPANQMARLKDAGLNPNLMYGQGSPGQSSSLPGVSGNGGNFNMRPTPIDSMSLYQNALAAQKQKIENDRAELRYQKEVNDYENDYRRLSAIRQFISDKMPDNAPLELTTVSVGRDGHYSHIRGFSDEELRRSPEYEQLNQLWQKGELNDADLTKLWNQSIKLNKENQLLDLDLWEGEGIKSLFNDSGEMKGAVGMFYKLLLLLVKVASQKHR